MKKAILISILSCFLMACEDNSASKAAGNTDSIISSCAPEPRAETDYLNTEGDYHSLFDGYHMGDMWGFTWYRENGSGYTFAVDVNNQLKKVNHGLVYSDSNCSTLEGEVFDYPLHLNGDTFVFKFEERFMEYPLGPGLKTVEPYWFKNEYGNCNPCAGSAKNVREVQGHVGSGISLAY